MLKKALCFTIIGVGLFSVVQVGVVESALQNPLGETKTLGQFTDVITSIVLKVGGLIAVFFIIWSGFLFATARGSEDQLKKAKSTFTWTVIGTAVLLGSSVIAKAVVNFLTGLQS